MNRILTLAYLLLKATGMASGLAAQVPYVFFEIRGPNNEGTGIYFLNDKGETVGFTDGKEISAFYRSATGSYVSLAISVDGQTIDFTPRGINNSGQITGSFYDGTVYRTVIGSIDKGFSEVSFPESLPSNLGAGINDAGIITGISIVVDPTSQHPNKPFVRGSSGVVSSFDCPNLPVSDGPDPQGINAAGTIVGYYLEPHAFAPFLRTSDQTCQTFPLLPGSTSTLFEAINNAGVVTGSAQEGNGSSKAFFGTPGNGFTEFHFPTPTSNTQSYAINNFNHLAGFGFEGAIHGFVGFPVTDSILEGAIPKINFVPRPVGTTSGPIHLTMHNNGTQPIGLLISTSDKQHFLATHDCPLVFPANAYCGIDVTATPHTLNDNFSTLIIQSSAQNGSPHIPIYISGQGASLAAQPTSYSFAPHPPGEMSGPGTIYFHESGSDKITFSDISITGPNAADFAITVNTCAAGLAGYGTCKVTVQTTPSATGYRNATLVLTSDAPQSPLSVPLKVYGKP